MGFFDSIGSIGGGLMGGIAGLPAGLFGAVGGGLMGGRVGQGLQNAAGLGPSQPGPDYSGMSPYPTYVGMEPDQMSLASQFSGANQPLDKFAGESLRNGPSQGTQFALQQNRLGANASRDQARGMAAGMGKDAQAQLAMRGGLGAGASERIGKYSTNVGMDAAQGADANAGANRSNLLIADEGARNGNLAQAAGLVGGQQAQRYGMASQDLARKQGEFDRRNQFNMGLYNTNMAAWGAGKQADATANSGKK